MQPQTKYKIVAPAGSFTTLEAPEKNLNAVMMVFVQIMHKYSTVCMYLPSLHLQKLFSYILWACNRIM